MKELSIEQKAKAYDEALKVLHKYDGAHIMFTQDLKEEMFPELKESDDEKIRKEIIKFLELPHPQFVGNRKHKEWIAWLEKQCKKQEVEGNPNARKPTLRIIKGKSYLCIKDYRDKNCTFTKGKIYKSDKDGFLVDDEEKDTFERKIWEEDAIEYFFLFEQSKTKNVVTDEKQKPADKVKPKFKVGDIVKHKDNPHLTYILKRFTDDGDYEFHAIGKDGNEGETCFSVVKYQDEWELVEQKTAWSEEDEKILNLIIARLHSHPSVESEEYDKDYHWFKSLKDRVQPKQEWNKEDERMYSRLHNLIYSTPYCDSRKELSNWLKSLRPQSRWKPSDEQMDALHYVTNFDYGGHKATLVSLYEQLKKLREELV